VRRLGHPVLRQPPRGIRQGLDRARPADPRGIDCFACHHTTGTYRKAGLGGGLPADGVDPDQVPHHVGRPSRAARGRCHLHSGGGANVKHGDPEPVLAEAPADLDVHMGRYDVLCQDSHTTTDPRNAGRSLSAPATEGPVACSDRHAADAVLCEHCHRSAAGLEEPVLGFFPGRQVANRDHDEEALTVRHLPTTTAGLHWQGGPISAREMEGAEDPVQHVLDLPMARPPGRRFESCRGASLLLSAILQRATGESAASFAERVLFGPPEIVDVSWSARACCASPVSHP
jgi:hypothetical protein